MGALFGVADVGPIIVDDFSTEIRSKLLEGWRSHAGDPDWAATQWLTSTGVPAGLHRHPEDCGIFPGTDIPDLPGIDDMVFEDTDS